MPSKLDPESLAGRVVARARWSGWRFARLLGWRGWAADAGAALRRLLQEAYSGDARTWEAFLGDSLPVGARRARDWFLGERPASPREVAAALDRLLPGWERRSLALTLALGRTPRPGGWAAAALAGVIVVALAAAAVVSPPTVLPPTILGPVGTHEHRDTKIRHAWAPVPGAIFYEFQFCNQPPHRTGCDQIRMIRGTSVDFDHQSIHCPLEWRVRAVDAFGRRSHWARATYRVDCP